MSSIIHPPRHLVWSTDKVDLSNPFQKRWYLQQILIHGTAEDIRRLDKDEVAREIDHLNLPLEIESLWRDHLGSRHEK
ncbi:MAG TPA: hypothetical protein PKK59_08830 [Anaerolineaceae bacterium]|nr:hypothetical protein [Anaerolineaceae bacterium]